MTDGNKEILDAIATNHALTMSRLDELEAQQDRVIADQIAMRAEQAGLVARVEALEASRGAHDNRLSAHERKIVDGIAEAKRMVSDIEVKVDGTLTAVEQRQSELAKGIEGIAGEMTAWKDDAKTAVLNALEEHVTKIEAAADTVARSPAVKTAGSVAGAVLGSAVVSAIIEALKHL